MNYGVDKVYWSDIKDDIVHINSKFYHIVEQLNVIKYPLYVCKFPFGEPAGDLQSQFIPNHDGSIRRLTDPSLPSELVKNLGYGQKNAPLAMVLEKQQEWYIEILPGNTVIPMLIKKPGDFFSYTKVLDVHRKFNYSPMGVLHSMSGARSLFLLPSIGCKNKFSKLNRACGSKFKHPVNLLDQHYLFQNIVRSPAIAHRNSWSSKIIYFSEDWVTNIKHNPDWSPLKNYFYDLFLRTFSYTSNVPYYNMAYSLILEKNNRNPSHYILDTFRMIMDISAGEMPGFAPLVDEEMAPVSLIQEVFSEFYGMKDIVPTMMGPSLFDINNIEESMPVYYSFQHPTVLSHNTSAKKYSAMSLIKAVKDVFDEIIPEIRKEHGFCSDTIIEFISKKINFSFFHNSIDIDNDVENVSELIVNDPRFFLTKSSVSSHQPAQESKFLRGCIRISG